MTEAVIVSAARSAIGRSGGAMASIGPEVFGAAVLKEALRRANIDASQVDDVILGNCLSGGGNMARLTALQAGFPIETTGLTIDRQCGSGIKCS